MAKPSSAKTRRRNHHHNKVRRTKSRRGGVYSHLEAWKRPYNASPEEHGFLSQVRSLSTMDYTPSDGGPKSTRAGDIRKLYKHLDEYRTTLELAGIDAVTVAQMVNNKMRKRQAIIDHNYPPTSSRVGNMFSSSMARMSGIFKPPRDVVYPIAQLTFPHDHRHKNMTELMKGLNPRSIEQLTKAFETDKRNITHITKKTNGDIYIKFKASHPGLGDRASFMIQND